MATTPNALDELRRALDRAQHTLHDYQARFEPLSLSPDSFTRTLLSRPEASAAEQQLAQAGVASPLEGVLLGEVTLSSRSAWYRHIEAAPGLDEGDKARLKLSVVDTAYNRLFTHPGEAFAMDRIRLLDALPPGMLDTTLAIRRMRKQRNWLMNGYRLFGLISTLGTDGLAALLAEEAVSYVEDKAKAYGYDDFTRKNWFGFYGTATRKIGVEQA